MRTLLRTLAVLLLGTLALGACTSGGDDRDPEARLQAAADEINAAEAIEFSIETDELPKGVSGVLSVQGQGDDSPSFEGEAEVSAAGSTLPAEVVVVDGQMWIKTGLTPDFLEVDPGRFGIPDPAQLIGSGEDSAVSLLTSAEDVESGDQVREGKQVLTTITGTIDGEDVARLLPTADPDGSFEAKFHLTEDDALNDLVISGPFYDGEDDVTYTMQLSAMDSAIDVTPPSE